jgi:hypothetical protein
MAGRSQAAMRAASKNYERAALVLELKRRGKTFAAIGAELGISAARTHQIYWGEIRRLTAETREQAKHALTEIVGREEMVVGEMATLLFAFCAQCGGAGCTNCNWTGHLYEPGVRVSAAGAIQRSNEQLARLFNLHRNRVELTVDRDFLEEVEGLSDEQLEREIGLFASHINEARLAIPPAIEDES